MRGRNQLTARGVDGKLPRGRYSDGGGLVLQVSKWGTKAWIFRYQRGGRERHMGLGSLSALSLAQARDVARECRRLLALGQDPIGDRKHKREQQRLGEAKLVRFAYCAEQYIAGQEPAWRNAKHRGQWRSTLQAYAFPTLRELVVAEIDTSHVLRCLEPIWGSKPETAKRLRGRIEAILDWAAVRGYRDRDNPARWRGHLDKLLPAPSKVRAVRHHPAMPWAEVPVFMAELRSRAELAARALELTILAALRTSEVVLARWSEFDFAQEVWTIPATRMKAKRDHRVPLSSRARDLLSALPQDGEWVFPSPSGGRALSNMAMLALLRRLGRADVTVHGFRSSFRDWAAETTGYANHVVEMALAHAVDDEVEAAYRRGELLDKRRRLMRDWARYCESNRAPASNIVAMRSAQNA